MAVQDDNITIARLKKRLNEQLRRDPRAVNLKGQDLQDLLYLLENPGLTERVAVLENTAVKSIQVDLAAGDINSLNSVRGLGLWSLTSDTQLLAGYIRRTGTAMTGGGTTFITNNDSGLGPGFYFSSDPLLANSSDWLSSPTEGAWSYMMRHGVGTDGVFDNGLSAGDTVYIWNDTGDHTGGDGTTVYSIKFLYLEL